MSFTANNMERRCLDLVEVLFGYLPREVEEYDKKFTRATR
jgi:hypothetical protein